MLVSLLVLIEIGCILMGAVVAPNPTQVMQQKSIFCVDKDLGLKDQWFHPRHCHHEDDLSSASNTHPEEIVFSLAIPHFGFSMSRWFQYLLTLLILKSDHHDNIAIRNNSILTLDIRVAYSNDVHKDKYAPKNWTKLFSTIEHRPLSCHRDTEILDEDDYEDGMEPYHSTEYDCDPLHLLQLGSVPHKYYLLNLRIPTYDAALNKDVNLNIGRVRDLEFVSITQTGGFTKVWISLKCCLFAILIFPTVWYWRRIHILARKPSLLEKSIFGLALSMLFVNLPLELVSILLDADWMLVFTDVRQGSFYAVLLSFWIIFIGEHLMDSANRDRLSNYKYQLGAIITVCMALLGFELAERGVQISRPTATVWENPSFAMSLLVLGSVASVMYFILLLHLVYKVFRSISFKGRFSLPEDRAKKFRRIINRFKIVMILSVSTAILTIVFFFLEQTLAGMLEDWFDMTEVKVASAFFTGVYGLWNIYIVVLLSMYAPSHKNKPEQQGTHEMDSINSRSDSEQNSQMLLLTQEKSRAD